MEGKILETKRVLLMEAEIEDAVFFYTLLNSKNWIQHIGDRGIETLEDAENYIEDSLIRSYNRRGYGLFKMILKSTSKPIGICGFVKRKELDYPDLGFAILPQYEGQGLTSEVAKATLQYGQETLGMKKVLGVTSSNNKASQKVLETAGLKQEGNVKIGRDSKPLLLYST